MIKDYNISNSLPKSDLTTVTVQMGFSNCFSCNHSKNNPKSKNNQWYRMGYIVIFNNLAGIPNVALLVRRWNSDKLF